MNHVSETTGWHVRYQAGAWLGAEPRHNVGLLGATFAFAFLGCIAFWAVLLLEIVLPTTLASILGYGAGGSLWIIFIRYRFRHVIHFEPPTFETYTRRVRAWRREAEALPSASLRVVAKAEFSTGQMGYKVALASEEEEWSLFEEKNCHREFMREVATILAEELGCPLEDSLDHSDIRRVPPGPASPRPEPAYHFPPPNKPPYRALMALGAAFMLFVWLVTLSQFEAFFAIVGTVVSGFMLFFGYRGLQRGGSVIDLQTRTVTHDVRASDPSPTPALSFDTPDAYIVVHFTRYRSKSSTRLYAAHLCAGPGSTPLPCAPGLDETAEALFPWVRECANQLQLPIEIVGEKTCNHWSEVMTESERALPL